MLIASVSQSIFYYSSRRNKLVFDDDHLSSAYSLIKELKINCIFK